MAGEKDIGERTLLECADVFADIWNVLVFGGERVIRAEDLHNGPERSQVKLEGKLHDQMRDVSKYWTRKRVRLALYGIENHTKVYYDLVPKILSYDAAEYKLQENQHRNASRLGEKPLPAYAALTAVLYFGLTRWTAPVTLKEYLLRSWGKEAKQQSKTGEADDSARILRAYHEKLEPLIPDYRVRVFEIAFLEPETVASFTSDFRIVADYFVQSRVNSRYVPSKETIQHVAELLSLMRVLTGDNRFLDAQTMEPLMDKEEVSMCDFLDEAINKGKREGIRIGEASGIKNGIKIGEANGKLKTLQELVLEGLLTPEIGAEKAGMKVSEFLNGLQRPFPYCGQ